MSTPADLIRQALANWATLDPMQFGAAEAEARMRYGDSPDLQLIYALRISLAVKGVTRLKTLASRWSVTWSGAGGAGLERGRASSLFRPVNEFLCELYRRRAAEVVQDEIVRATQDSAKKQRPEAKAKPWTSLAEDLDAADTAFRASLPGWDGIASTAREACEGSTRRSATAPDL